MTLDYIYHSGFAIEMEGVTVIIDYYKDSSETEHNRGIVHDYLLQRLHTNNRLALEYQLPDFMPSWLIVRP